MALLYHSHHQGGDEATLMMTVVEYSQNGETAKRLGSWKDV